MKWLKETTRSYFGCKFEVPFLIIPRGVDAMGTIWGEFGIGIGLEETKRDIVKVSSNSIRSIVAKMDSGII